MKWTDSIRGRLLLWLGLLLAAVLSGFGMAAYQLQRTQLFAGMDEELAELVSQLSQEARGTPPSGGREGREPGFGGGGPGERMPRDREGPDRDGFGGFDEPFGPPGPPPDFEDRSPDDRELKISSELMKRLGDGQEAGFAVWRRGGTLRGSNLIPVPNYPSRAGHDTLVRFRHRGHWREAYHFTEIGECVLVGRDGSEEIAELHRAGIRLGLAGVGVLAIGLGGGWWLATRSLQPIDEMSRTARRISEGRLSERVPVGSPDSELGRLATVMNTTFDRLESAFDRQRQFTADASHELRTPLTLMISEAQTVLSRDRAAADYREAVEQCLEAAVRMRDLTASLLQLARIEGELGEASTFELRACVRTEIEALGPRIESSGVRVDTDLLEVVCLGDAIRAGRVVANLLGNAVHHTPPGGRVVLSMERDDVFVVLVVEDTGSGIAAEDLPHIFERFYRADKVRSRSEGRFGLGLAICKAAMEADGGSIMVSSKPGSGTRFEVRWKVDEAEC
ncbi:signal transduction histidine kinase [Haloferula luteola]|uniref:histidine kinase n=1 Tax=Haloferula luteola TaxID=595692 RepID=A0A840V2V1_9BACT|nr:ATP-binding protein [Haloferula luteola]MBB5351803.1 signal transduction histidine kinase [Haloferula luteola]